MKPVASPTSPCIVCGTGNGVTTPKRKIAICSKKCYDQLQKSVLVYGETMQRQQDELKKRQEKK